MKKQLFLAAIASVGLSLPCAAAERSEVPEKYRWNTADIYPDDAAWDKQKAETEAALPRLAAWQGRTCASPQALLAALDDLMGASLALSRLQTYANMRSDEDTRVAKYRRMSQAAADLGTKISAATAFFSPELIAAGREKIDGFVAAEPKLKPYKPWLDDTLRWAPHTLSAPEEKVAAQAGLLAGAPENIRSAFTDAELPYPVVKLSDGKEVRLDAAAYTLYRASPDQEDRRKVFQAFWKRYSEFTTTLGTALNAEVNAHIFTKEVRKFDSCLEAALFSQQVPVTVYRQLVADVHENLPTLHRYLKLQRRLLGVKQLGYEDLYAPVVKEASRNYTPEEARELVLKAVEPLGPQYAADLKRSYDERWVDFMPSTAKKSGAYSTGVYGVHPYQLQNFTGTLDEVSTLAHESGHSMHTLLAARHQPYVTSDYKTFVAEVASTLNEALLYRRLLAGAKTRDERLALLSSRLENLRQTLFRQVLFAEFELLAHETAEKGEPLTGEKLSSIYLGLLKEYYGDAAGICKVDDLYGMEWAYVDHFYMNFYVYQYATSIVASAALAEGILDERAAGTSTARRDAYLGMLAAGSSKEPIALLKDAGVDMTTPAPFKAAMREMNSVMDEIEKLL